MTIGRRSARGLVCSLLTLATLGLTSGVGRAELPDSLTLQQVEGFKVWRVYDKRERSFQVFMTWKDVPDSIATYIHQPDTTGWVAGHQPSEMSVPASGGIYTSDVDRTISFLAKDTGQIGVSPSIRIEYYIRREEFLSGAMNLGADSLYTPGKWVELRFRNTDPTSPDYNRTYDFGVRVSFSAGWVDQGGGFDVGLEDFEGYHLWRGIMPDGSDFEVIGELSKEEAHLGSRTGGSVVDSVYYYSVIDTLRASRTWYSDFGSIDCLGTAISLPLADDEMFWYDCNAFNGYTYYYAVTTFDRGYGVKSGRQGLVKKDKWGTCPPCEQVLPDTSTCVGITPQCIADHDIVALSIEVDAQDDDIKSIYAVPNPYRTGGSRLTQENYHNFPDDKVRFVNVPQKATLRVYTVSGDLVWETTHDGYDGNIEWDVRNRGGNEVGSGVYIFKVEAENGDVVYGRLVIIR
jgi:hypothetical protein